MNFKLLLFISSFLISLKAGMLCAQQIYIERKEEVEMTKKVLDQIYNFRFEEAEKSIQSLENKFPGRPGADLLKALHIYWKNFPIRKGTEPYQTYETCLTATVDKADKILGKNSQDVEGIFFSLAGHGYLAAYYAEEREILKAVAHARKAYSSLKRGFELKDEYAEFQFTTGLYNYYREKYPETHPVFKPFAWFFESGDKKVGIDQLVYALDHALFTKYEACYYLFHIFLRYENKPSEAIGYARTLHRSYPENKMFLAYYIEALIFNKEYASAEKLLKKLEPAPKSFYLIPESLFLGMLEEKYKGNLQEAKKFYGEALKLGNEGASDTSHYLSLAHTGLARIADKEGNVDRARDHYKESLKLSTYDIVVDEAKNYSR